jgi:hypothetical protein
MANDQTDYISTERDQEKGGCKNARNIREFYF